MTVTQNTTNPKVAGAEAMREAFEAGITAAESEGFFGMSEVVADQLFTEFMDSRDTPTEGQSGEGVARTEWRCFHCGDVFTDERCARLHFGRDEDSETACLIKAGAEQGLLGALREAEYAAADARHAIADETTDAAKAYYAQATRHAQALRNAEEAGYERGLDDGRALPTPLPTEAPEGWRLVPVEATEAMCAAFTDAALRGSVHGAGGWHGYAREQWATMLSAAPTPEVPSREAGDVAAAEDRVIRAMCRERCAEFGDPPCYEIAPEDWTSGCDGCDCHQLGPVAVRAALHQPQAPKGDEG